MRRRRRRSSGMRVARQVPSAIWNLAHANGGSGCVCAAMHPSAGRAAGLNSLIEKGGPPPLGPSISVNVTDISTCPLGHVLSGASERRAQETGGLAAARHYELLPAFVRRFPFEAALNSRRPESSSISDGARSITMLATEILAHDEGWMMKPISAIRAPNGSLGANHGLGRQVCGARP